MRKWLGLAAAFAAVCLFGSQALADANTNPLVFPKTDASHLAITSSLDTSTGIYFPAPGEMCFAVNGVTTGCNSTGNPPGGVNGQLQYNSLGSFGGFSMNGDCTMAVPTITCLSTGGVPFGAFATASPASPPAIGGTTPAAGSFSALTDTAISGLTQCVHANSSGILSGTGSDCGSGGGGGAFSGLTGGTNTSAAMVVGTGASLSASGSGSISSTTLLGANWASPAAIGTTAPNAGTFTSLTDAGVSGSTQCLHVNTSGLVSGSGIDCNNAPFSQVLGGTNTTAAMVVGTGSSITASGTGTINATQLGGKTFANPGPIGSGGAGLGVFSSLQISGLGLTSTQCLHANSSGQVSATGSDCGTGSGGGSVGAGAVAQLAGYETAGTAVSPFTVNGPCADLVVNTTSQTMGVTLPVEGTLVSSYSLQASDMGCTIPMSGTGLTLTIPLTGFGTTILAPGQVVSVENIGSAPIGVTNATGVTMNPPITSIPPGYTLELQGASGAILDGMLGGPPGQLVSIPSLTETTAACYITSSAGGGGEPCGGGADCGSIVNFTSSSTVVVTVTNSGEPAGCVVKLIQAGTGKVTVVAGTGATVHFPGAQTGTAAQWGEAEIDVISNTSGSNAVATVNGDIS